MIRWDIAILYNNIKVFTAVLSGLYKVKPQKLEKQERNAGSSATEMTPNFNTLS